MEFDLKNIKIDDIIPQRRPVKMIDKVVGYDDDKFVTSLMITIDNIFTEENYLTEPGLIENIAQTAAASAGLNSLRNRAQVPLGFIGAIKNLKLYALPAIGDDIKTTVKTDFEISNARSIKGFVNLNQQLIAECEMKIFIFNE